MDRKTVQIDTTIKNFVKKIRAKFKPVRIILFGSRATGEAWNYSDYDFIIISDTFKKLHWLERIGKIVQYWSSDRPIDILPYTNKEFEQKKKNSSVVREALKRGIDII